MLDEAAVQQTQFEGQLCRFEDVLRVIGGDETVTVDRVNVGFLNPRLGDVPT